MKPSPLLWILSLLCASLAAPAAASDTLDFRPQRVGGQLCLRHDLVLLQPLPGAHPPMVTAGDPPWQVVYLNFGSEQLSGGTGRSDSRTNETSLVTAAHFAYPEFQSWDKLGSDRQQSIQDVTRFLELIFAKFAVRFVSERPSEGDYTMVMMGGDGRDTAAGTAAIGVSPLDGPPRYARCGNNNRNDIVFVFGDKIAANRGARLARMLALVAAHELGHSFGLEHITDNQGIMYPQATIQPTLRWVSAPVEGGPGVCGAAHQDAEQLLHERLGPGRHDAASPSVWFKHPGSGAVLPPDLSFEVAAADDLGVHHVEVFLDGKKVLSLTEPPYTAALTDVSEGAHVLRAEVQDWANRRGSVETAFTVDASCVGRGSCNFGMSGLDGECQAGSDCESGLCALARGTARCVVACDAEAPACPGGSTCRAVNATRACLPEGAGWSLDMAGDGQGGCSAAGARGGSRSALSALVLLALLGLALYGPRRRR